MVQFTKVLKRGCHRIEVALIQRYTVVVPFATSLLGEANLWRVLGNFLEALGTQNPAPQGVPVRFRLPAPLGFMRAPTSLDCLGPASFSSAKTIEFRKIPSAPSIRASVTTINYRLHNGADHDQDRAKNTPRPCARSDPRCQAY